MPDKESKVLISLEGQPLPVERNLFQRLVKTLGEHKLAAEVIGGVVVFGAAAALTAEVVHHHRQRAEREVPPPLTPDQENQYNQLHADNLQRMTNYFLYRGLPQTEAEDKASEVFTRAYQHFSEFTAEAGLEGVKKRAWLYKIAGNLLKNHYRDTGRRPEISMSDVIAQEGEKDSPEDRFTEDSDSVEDQIIHRQEMAEARYALHQLIPQYQLVIWLKLDGLPNSEISYVFGTTEQAIKSLYHRATLAYKEKLRAPKK